MKPIDRIKSNFRGSSEGLSSEEISAIVDDLPMFEFRDLTSFLGTILIFFYANEDSEYFHESGLLDFIQFLNLAELNDRNFKSEDEGDESSLRRRKLDFDRLRDAQKNDILSFLLWAKELNIPRIQRETCEAITYWRMY